MKSNDLMRYSLQAIFAVPLRSFLTILGISIGISAVVLLTGLGEGLHRFVLGQFTQFGTNLIGITPGKSTTTGMSGAVISNVRPLGLADAIAIAALPEVVAAVPLLQGNAAVKANQRERRTTIYAVGSQVPKVWKFPVGRGQFLPNDDLQAPRAFVVLGSRVQQELFGNESSLGKILRIGGFRFRVIGVMSAKGQMLGFDLDDAVYIPAAKGMEMFNKESLMEIDVLYPPGQSGLVVSQKIKEMLKLRHGTEDFTLTTQDQMLETLGSVLNILTLGVGALGGISLLVGGVGILTILMIGVRERTGEIGLLRALGMAKKQILLIFLADAFLLSAIGGITGLALGTAATLLIQTVSPEIHTYLSWQYILLSQVLALGIGLAAGIYPAYQASMVSPLEAMRSE